MFIMQCNTSILPLYSCLCWLPLARVAYFRCYNITVRKMINEITINSNNAIQMSRGQLLSWVNDLLKTNLSKIQQLGTGAIYCQLIDVLYPNKIPLAKVNWKAKFDYEFVSNFKILQQSFTKLGILKNIEVEKLVKCKYQDNLEFLQWFKKIFDSNGNTGSNYNPQLRRGENQLMFDRKQKENRTSSVSTSNKEIALSSSKNVLDFTDRSALGCASFQMSDRDDTQQLKLPISSIKPNNCSSLSINPPNSPQPNLKILDSPWRDQLKQRSFADEKEFYLRKFKEIEHLMEEWNTERTSSELIDHIRKIILVAPNVEWSVADGEYCEVTQPSD